MKQDAIYGQRRDRHQAIMMMDAKKLHTIHPFTADLTFNEVMLKNQFHEQAVPDSSCIFGVSKEGKPHRFCVGNEQGEILPKFLMAKLIVIESGKVYGNEMSTTVNLEERDRLYAMVREAQLRGISPLATKVEKKNKRLAAEHKVTVKKQKVVELDSESDCGIIS